MFVNLRTVCTSPDTWTAVLPATQLPSCSLQHKFLCYRNSLSVFVLNMQPVFKGGVVRRVGKSQRRKQMSDERSYLSARSCRLKTRAQRNAVRILHESYWYSETQISNFLLAERRKYKKKKIGGETELFLLKSILFSFLWAKLDNTAVNATCCSNVYHLQLSMKRKLEYETRLQVVTTVLQERS